MAIQDLIVVRASEELPFVIEAFIKTIGADLQTLQKGHYTLITGKYWSGVAQNASLSMMDLYYASIGFSPNFTFAFTLDKPQLYEMRLQLLKAVVGLGAQTKSDTAYFENYYSPILRYKDGQLELKTHQVYWPPEELAKLSLPYSELPELPTL